MSRVVVALAVVLFVSTPAAASPSQTITPGELLVGLNMGQAGFQVGAVRGTQVVLARGYEIDVARRIGRRLGLTVRFVHEPVFSRLVAPGDKPWDLAIAEISINDARRSRVDFSRPYLEVDQGVLLAKGANVQPRISALRPLRLCAQRDTTSAIAIVERIKPIKKPRLYPKQEGLLDGLFQKQCEAVVADAPILAVSSGQAPDRYGKLLGRIDTAESYGVVFEKGSALRKKVNGALAELERAGILDALERRWLGADLSTLPILR